MKFQNEFLIIIQKYAIYCTVFNIGIIIKNTNGIELENEKDIKL